MTDGGLQAAQQSPGKGTSQRPQQLPEISGLKAGTFQPAPLTTIDPLVLKSVDPLLGKNKANKAGLSAFDRGHRIRQRAGNA